VTLWKTHIHALQAISQEVFLSNKEIPGRETTTKSKMISWSTWVAQLVKRPTLDFGSGHDLRVVRSSPTSGPMLGMEPA